MNKLKSVFSCLLVAYQHFNQRLRRPHRAAQKFPYSLDSPAISLGA